MIQTVRVNKAVDLKGEFSIPGDKSISHRALMLGGLAKGKTTVKGLLESEDVLATGTAMQKLGVKIENQDGNWIIHGTGNGAMLDPTVPLDFGNAGTGVRLFMGLITGQGLKATFIGDASLSSRPMGRIVEPLQQMGAKVLKFEKPMRLPITLQSQTPPLAINYVTPVASAQVKSAVLLAGLGARGTTTVTEKTATRDHTERMFKHFSIDIDVAEKPDGSRIITLPGNAEPVGCAIEVPGDPSSAAFLIVAALICPGSKVRVKNVMINPLRAGLFQTLKEMGANIQLENKRMMGGEEVADIVSEYSQLKAVDVPAERAPSMIDEYPILSVAASFAEGETRMRGLGELRVKEADRLTVMQEGLALNGVSCRVEEDDLFVSGNMSQPGGGFMRTHLDHRIAMSFIVFGLASDKPVTIDDVRPIATSFPDFCDLIIKMGANLENL